MMSLIRTAAAITIGITAGISAVRVFNLIPAKWLCDYNEEPEQGMWGVRIKDRPWILVFVLVFTAAAIKLLIKGFLFAIPGIISLWLLLLISIADKKYMIIPDQLVITLAVAAFGFIPFHESYQTQLAGALIGGGCVLLIAIIGKLLFRKEAVGFGDVKLLAAIGLLIGLKGIVITIIITFFSSALIFGIGMLAGKLKTGDIQPLGPFISASTSLYILFQTELLALADLYMRP